MIAFYIVVLGFLSLFGQITLSRELICVFSSGELFVVFGISLCIFATSLGIFTSLRTNLRRIKILFIFYGISFLILFLFTSSLRSFIGVQRGLLLPLDKQLFCAIIILFPFGFFSGKLFGEVSLIYLQKDGTPAKSYALDTLGAVFGGIFSLLANHFMLPLSLSVVFFLFLSIFSATLKNSKWKSLALAVSSLLLFLLFPLINFLHFSILKIEEPFLKEIRETPNGRIAISENRDQVTLFLNNSLSFESQSTQAEEFVHLPLLCSNHPQRVLLIGGCGEGVLKEVKKYNPEVVDVVELSKEFVELPQKYIKDDRFASLKNKGANLIIGDGRKFLKNCSNYDVILVSSTAPGSIAEGRFFTEEFYKSVRNKLNADGVFAIRIRGSENYLSGLLFKRTCSALKKIDEIFESSMIIPFSTTLAIGIKGKLPESEKIIKRFEERKIETQLVSSKYLCYILENERRKKMEEELKNSKCETTSDLKPSAYFLTLLLETSRTYPKIAFYSNLLAYAFYFSISIAFIIAFSILIGRFVFKIEPGSAIVFASGFSAMTYESLILIYYQLKKGVLYKDIGFITAIFMLGLMVGSLLFPEKVKLRRLVYLVLILLMILPLFLILKIEVSSLIIFVVVFSGGFSSGSLFKLSQNLITAKKDEALRKLYFLDLLGGSIGGITSTLLFIPLFGLELTLLFTGVTLLLCL